MLNRENRACEWVKKTLKQNNFQLRPLAGDASFRCYYRLCYEDKQFILMDAPPDREPITPFLQIATRLKNQGVPVPEVHLADEICGFAMLEDFGDMLFLAYVNKENADSLYKMAMEALLILQKTNSALLSPFDAQFMRTELNLFSQWFLRSYLKLNLSNKEEAILEETFNYLTTEIEELPTVFVHRDYHSRNLMMVSNTEPIKLGILDFQDAMLGPFAYDLTSLLKDCYIQWPREQILQWVQFFYIKHPLAKDLTLSDFIKAFDLCGLQRHLKVLGIFSRLFLRDNKPQFLKDLPLTLHYVLAYLETAPNLAPFYAFLQERVRLP